MARGIALLLVSLALLSAVAGEYHVSVFNPADYGFEVGDSHAVFTLYLDTNATGEPNVAGFRFPDFTTGRLVLPSHPMTTSFDVPSSVELPYKIFSFDWNPNGHPGGLSLADRATYNKLPDSQKAAFLAQHGAWMVPHFDFHLYHVGIDFLDDIQCEAFPPCSLSANQKAAATNYPPARFLPRHYVPDINTVVPMMGLHWDDASEDVTPAHYAANPAVIYGSWNGRMIFTETMPAKSTFETIRATGATYTGSLKRPLAFQRTGHYAGQFRIHYDSVAEEFVIEIFDFERIEVDAAYAPDEWREAYGEFTSSFETWKRNSCNN